MRAHYFTNKHTTNPLSSIQFPRIRKNIHNITAHVCVLRCTYIRILCSLSCIDIYIYICVCVCVRVCMYVCVCIYIYIYKP
jgi:hypothetical protein